MKPYCRVPNRQDNKYKLVGESFDETSFVEGCIVFVKLIVIIGLIANVNRIGNQAD